MPRRRARSCHWISPRAIASTRLNLCRPRRTGRSRSSRVRSACAIVSIRLSRPASRLLPATTRSTVRSRRPRHPGSFYFGRPKITGSTEYFHSRPGPAQHRSVVGHEARSRDRGCPHESGGPGKWLQCRQLSLPGGAESGSGRQGATRSGQLFNSSATSCNAPENAPLG